MLNRRSLITGLVAFAAAPAIVRATSLMPVKVMIPDGLSIPAMSGLHVGDIVSFRSGIAPMGFDEFSQLRDGQSIHIVTYVANGRAYLHPDVIRSYVVTDGPARAIQ
jgi:hypothetical protein